MPTSKSGSVQQLLGVKCSLSMAGAMIAGLLLVSGVGVMQ